MTSQADRSAGTAPADPLCCGLVMRLLPDGLRRCEKCGADSREDDLARQVRMTVKAARDWMEEEFRGPRDPLQHRLRLTDLRFQLDALAKRMGIK